MAELIPNIEQQRRIAMAMVADRLLAEMHPDGYWEGRLSSSALSTATAISALSISLATGGARHALPFTKWTEADASLAPTTPHAIAEMIVRGCWWLGQHQNSDGGWGDTPDSPSNLSTTLLAVAAFKLAEQVTDESSTVTKAQQYLAGQGAGPGSNLSQVVSGIYGKDRTFAVPILCSCALAGMLSWDDIPSLPFELAALPSRWYSLLRLEVVSYALPALIAIGLAIHRRKKGGNPVTALLRRVVTARVLAKLQRIQPSSGGFLEATPLTSFVAMSLIPLVGASHPVAAKCLSFIRQSQRSDGSWPIDSNLSVWLTTAAVAALAASRHLSYLDRWKTLRWISQQQHKTAHRYTNAAAGGWAWTHLPGGVPDVDDTCGAMIALALLDPRQPQKPATQWLLCLRNRDGGWPTFCRGWGRLPFDRSAPDLTAHALRALHAVDRRGHNSASEVATAAGLRYLLDTQQPDGSWLPLWFGNQHAPGHHNPVLGTARVLRALEALKMRGPAEWRGVQYLLDVRNADGGWGGAAGVPSTIEETALAVSALAGWADKPPVQEALADGVSFLCDQVRQGRLDHPAPIGLYFASLWYSERLYPIIWTLEALGRAGGEEGYLA